MKPDIVKNGPFRFQPIGAIVPKIMNWEIIGADGTVYATLNNMTHEQVALFHYFLGIGYVTYKEAAKA
jgi:hypothetical protein